MPAERYTSQGTAWVVTPRIDRNRVRTDGSKLETEEPFDLRKGTIRGLLAVLLVVVVAWAAICVFHQSPAAPRDHAPVDANAPTSAVEAGAGNGVVGR